VSGIMLSIDPQRLQKMWLASLIILQTVHVFLGEIHDKIDLSPSDLAVTE
jgi:hypothetical protein